MTKYTVTNRSLHITCQRFWWLILVVGLLGASGAYAIGQNVLPQKHYASVDLLVTRAKQSGQGDALANQQADVHLIATMTSLVSRPAVLQPVAEKFGLSNQDLARHIRVATEQNAQLFSIQVQAKSLVEARSIADNLAEQTRLEAKRLFGTKPVTVMGPASKEWRISQKQPVYMAIAGALSTMFVVILVIHYVTRRQHKRREVWSQKKWRSET